MYITDFHTQSLQAAFATQSSPKRILQTKGPKRYCKKQKEFLSCELKGQTPTLSRFETWQLVGNKGERSSQKQAHEPKHSLPFSVLPEAGYSSTEHALNALLCWGPPRSRASWFAGSNDGADSPSTPCPEQFLGRLS